MILAAFLVTLATPALAQKVPFVEPGTQPGPNESHHTPEILPGDQWAKLRISVDAKGRPTKCAIAETNVRSKEQRFWMCQAMMSDWHIEPLMENGAAVPGVVVRMLVLPSRRHPTKK